jgi:hypothetical protein
MYYLVSIDVDNEFFRKFKRFFKQHNIDYAPDDYVYAGFVKGNEDDGEHEGKDIYVVSDDEDDYPEAEVISLEEWAKRFPQEGILSSLPEYYLVETDISSPFWKDFRHFHVEEVNEDDFTPGDYTYVGQTKNGWRGDDDSTECPECDVITLEEWKQLRKPQFEAW